MITSRYLRWKLSPVFLPLRLTALIVGPGLARTSDDPAAAGRPAAVVYRPTASADDPAADGRLSNIWRGMGKRTVPCALHSLWFAIIVSCRIHRRMLRKPHESRHFRLRICCEPIRMTNLTSASHAWNAANSAGNIEMAHVPWLWCRQGIHWLLTECRLIRTSFVVHSCPVLFILNLSFAVLTAPGFIDNRF